MKDIQLLLAVLFLTFGLFGVAHAVTNCDNQPKPAFSCPTGYSTMCISAGGDHWGCGREVNGQIIEQTPPQQNLSPAAENSIYQNNQSDINFKQENPVPDTGASTISATSTQKQGSSNKQGSTPKIIPSKTTSVSIRSGTTTPENLQPQINIDTVGQDKLSSRPMVFVLAGALAFFSWFWWREWMKRKKKTLPTEKEKGKTEPIKARPCSQCKGTGKEMKSYTETYPCAHCKGSGIDPCHHCGGTGKMSMPNPPGSQDEVDSWPPCDFCGGSGKTRLEAGGASANIFPCCFCKGKRKETVTRHREVSCSKCGGSGEANR